MKDTTQQARSKGVIFPLILILAGTVLFLTRAGVIERQLVLQMLPLVPVSIGTVLLASRLRRRAD